MLSVASPGKPIENAISGTDGLDGAQNLDGANESTALGYDAVGGIGDGHLKIPATRFGSGGGVGDRPADHNLGRAWFSPAPCGFCKLFIGLSQPYSSARSNLEFVGQFIEGEPITTT